MGGLGLWPAIGSCCAAEGRDIKNPPTRPERGLLLRDGYLLATYHRPAKLLTGVPQTPEISLTEVVVSLPEVLHRVVKPLLLMFRRGL